LAGHVQIGKAEAAITDITDMQKLLGRLRRLIQWAGQGIPALDSLACEGSEGGAVAVQQKPVAALIHGRERRNINEPKERRGPEQEKIVLSINIIQNNILLIYQY
jgi:hypothetical protein